MAEETQVVETPTQEQVDSAVNAAMEEAVAEVTGNENHDGEGGSGGESEAQPTHQDEEGKEVKPVEEPPKGEAPKEEELKAAPAKVDYSNERALFERAIKAGISVEDALGFPTIEMAKRMVVMAEKNAGIESPSEDDPNGGVDNSPDELGKALKEMEEDGEYDPKILGLLKGLYNENKALKTARETAEKSSSFDKEFGSLDDGVRSHVDATLKSKLKSKFDMLSAGYKAQGHDVSAADVFQEASKLALGELMEKVAEERKTEALNQRKNLQLARPSGENGKSFKKSGPASEEDIANELMGLLNN